MIRPVLIELALFLAPFAAYALFLWATRAGVLDVEAWSLPRLSALLIAALVLMIVGFIGFAHFSGGSPDSTYVPAHMENGELVPGRLEPGTGK